LPGLENIQPGTIDLRPVLEKNGADLTGVFDEALTLYTWAVEKRSA
jgi:hypothetical protein